MTRALDKPGRAMVSIFSRAGLAVSPWEAAPWVIAIAAFFLFPGYVPLFGQILVMTLFALSLDIVVGYCGIVTLGHAALYGTGAYTAGLLAVHGWTEPISNALCAAAVAALAGFLTGAVILRAHGFIMVMLTLAVTVTFYEIANHTDKWTGGDDGLKGIDMAPVLGYFDFDIYGRTAFFYCLTALFLAFVLVRLIVNSPFGWSLRGIRENIGRMHAIGCPVYWRLLQAYTIAAGLAGLAGALQAQTTQYVALRALSFDLSGDVLIMLIIGGVGRLYGAFIGVPLYLLAQDELATQDAANWYFWMGILLIVIVLFARGGILALAGRLGEVLARRRA
jgi:branched-chain amino acid transport system permease protein